MAPRLNQRLATRESAMLKAVIVQSRVAMEVSPESTTPSTILPMVVEGPKSLPGIVADTANDTKEVNDDPTRSSSLAKPGTEPSNMIPTKPTTRDVMAEDAPDTKAPIDDVAIEQITLTAFPNLSTSLSSIPNAAYGIATGPLQAGNPNQEVSTQAISGQAGTGVTKQEATEIRRKNPGRLAAVKMVGAYAAMGLEETRADRHTVLAQVAPTTKKHKRKRGDGPNGRAGKSGLGNPSQIVSTSKATAKIMKSEVKPAFTKGLKQTSKRTKRVRSRQRRNLQVVQTRDDNDSDSNFQLSTKRPNTGNKAKSIPGRRGLRQREKPGVLFQHVGKHTETKMTTTRLAGSEMTRTGRRLLRKETLFKSSQGPIEASEKPNGRRYRKSEGKPSEEQATPEQTNRKRRRLVRMAGQFTNHYKIRFGWTPFPNNTRPFQHVCHKVFHLLKNHHETEVTLEKYTDDQNGPAGDDLQRPMHAGQEVTFDAIVRTILSQATNNDNAQTAEQSLIHRFRHDFLGAKVKGKSPNYHAILRAPGQDLAKALASGGLQHIKAKSIKGCLEVVYAENIARATTQERLNAESTQESPDFVPGMLSLDYMLPMGLQEKFDHLVSMPGIGVKTAACILAFNFEYPLFAVDTHVMRLSRMLRWLPLNASSEDHAFMHLNYRVPNELKFGLHQAFWHHGQHCVRCQAGTTQNSKGWADTNCPIESLVDRSRKSTLRSKKPKPAKEDDEVEQPSQDLDEDIPKAKRVKKQPHVLPHSKLSPQRAEELGFELRTIMIDDGFGVRRANRTAKPLLKWVLKSDHHAMESTDRKTTAEDIATEAELPGEIDGVARDGEPKVIANDTEMVEEAGTSDGEVKNMEGVGKETRNSDDEDEDLGDAESSDEEPAYSEKESTVSG